ncbi:MAG: cell surface protein SprA [Flavobacteriales bacterium]|nr:cell surface protein SprA [Bacteroidota bacterium]MCB9240673.1 cell surface protein SprA [Flavobacteriales bacterium]
MASSAVAQVAPDSTGSDSLKYPIRDRSQSDFDDIHQFDFKDPNNLRTDVTYNPDDHTYSLTRKVGDNRIGNPEQKTFDEYLEYQQKQAERDYFRQKSGATNFVRGSGILPDLYFDPQIIEDLFGNGLIDIRPSGSAEVIFGGNFNRVENPNFTARQQKNGNFDFSLKMQVNVTGQIGDRMKINTNYNTEATFEFENQTKLNWEGKEDDILKNVELGNVSLPLNGSLIQGGQSLFGLKTKLQFGKLTVTAIATQQKGETRETEINGGAQVTKFNIQASDYDVNRHYFLSQYFANTYDSALSRLPLIQSNVLINYIEVWVTNRAANYNNTGNLVAMMDLGESDPYNTNFQLPGGSNLPRNEANRLYSAMTNSPDATKNQLRVGIEYVDLSNARQLNSNEYTINERLGYVSLNQALNTDEILAVAYEYTYNGIIYKVGEFARDRPPNAQNIGTLAVKLLKSNLIKTNLPTWDLMMKNIYSLGAYNMQTEDFSFNVVYADDNGAGDLGYLPVQSSESLWYQRQLNQVFRLDNMNRQFEAKQDGMFDIIEGVTIQTAQGRIIFPMREPFGNYARRQFRDPNGKTADYYAFDALYDSTKWDAEQDVAHDKFFLRGSYKGSSSNQIRLQCFNVPRGSVKVTANGSQLSEGSDYIVDYTIGMVTIINEGILGSGAVIKASCESNSLFNMQQKTLVGTRLDYKVSDKLLLGGTLLHLTERPLTPKTNIGEEPLLNTIYGFDGAFNTESRMLTRWVDKLPFIETKEESTVALNWEFAQIIPHKPLSIGDAERGTSFIDDFEGAETPFDLKTWARWKIASVPQHQPDLFPLADGTERKLENNRRALLSWYMIDPLFQNASDNRMPDHLRNDVNQRSGHFVRAIPFDEPFPEKNIQQSTPRTLPTLDLAFYPNLRGPYNYNINDLKADGTLDNPSDKWAGISRRIENTDFEAANYDYIEMWILDPFVYEKNDPTSAKNTGQLYINLGSVSEDVLPDKHKSAENALPTASNTTPVDVTECGIVGRITPIIDGFDNDPNARPLQDIGLDGLDDDGERLFFEDIYLKAVELKHGTNSTAYANAFADPSGDNFVHHREENYDNIDKWILGRYQYYNHLEGNSSLNRLKDGTPKSNSTLPDDEDINADNTLDQVEEYFQYRINLSQEELRVGSGYVTDSIRVYANREDKGHKPDSVTYYQLKIPIREYQKRVGGISNFKSIRFMRMYLHGFEDSIIIRFLNLQMIRADWRRYRNSLRYPASIGLPPDPTDPVEFVVSTVNINENSKRVPVKYVVPPGISRELDPTQPNQVLQNEQSLSLRVCDLEKGDARGAFRVTEIDIRNYERMKMYIHAEGDNLQNGDVWAFIRIGTDLENNYYEYRMPLNITLPGAALQTEVWPEANNMDFALEDLYNLKLERENATGSKTATFEKTTANGHLIRVVGLPDLSQVRSMMLGILNPDGGSVPDKLCTEVWFNELRVTGIANKGGWAASARMVTKLADFARVNISGNYQTIGFGGIDKTLNERNLDQTFQYDISSNVELGKFFPQKSGITIPMYIGWNENFINPKYYPLNPDILYKQALSKARNAEERTKIKQTSQDYTSRYSLNFTNVKKNRTKAGKSHLWDVENFNASYSYQRVFRRNQVIEEQFINTHRASLAYNYSSNAKPWTPFKGIKAKQLGLIRDFNLGLVPKSVNVQFDVDRRYGELQNRSNDDFKAIVQRFYDKSFTMKRTYGARWNLMKSLKFDYNAIADAWVQEPFGKIDTEEKRDTIMDNIRKLGTLLNYNQTMNLNYTVPFSKIRALSWITASAKYGANYGWTMAPPAVSQIGNTIQNSQTINLNTNLNFSSFYNRSKLLRKFVAVTPVNQSRKTTRKPSSGTEDEEDEDEKKKKQEMSPIVKGTGRFFLMIKQAQLTYTSTNGTSLPGFSPSVQYLGRNFDLKTPSWPFILGMQDPELRYDLARNGFLSGDSLQNNRYTELSGQTVSGKATLEPFPNFRISLNVDKRTSNTLSSNFRYNTTTEMFEDLGLQELGQYSVSFFSWSSAFDKIGDGTNGYRSQVFEDFKNYRFDIAKRIQQKEFTEGGNDRYNSYVGEIDTATGFPVGYNKTQQDVMLYSFLAAYGGKGADGVSLNPFKRLPAPGWRVSYNGLKDLFGLKKWFTNISITHGYSSMLNLNSYYTELEYGKDQLSDTSNLKAKYTFQQGVSLIERLTPVLGIDVSMQSGLTLKLEYKRERNVTLYMNTFQMIEQRNKEYVVGAGYRTSNVRLPFKVRSNRILLENDLNFRFDLSIRDGITIRRDIELGQNQAQAGTRMFTVRPTIDYKVNDSTNIRMFYNRNVNKPKNSQSFPTALTDFGISIRYTLQ